MPCIRPIRVAIAVAFAVGLLITFEVVPVRTVAQQAQQSSLPTGIVIGRVVDGTTGASVPGATVTMSGIPLKTRRVIVDSQGRFLFHQLPPGIFTITATRTGYLQGSYGMLRPDGGSRQLELADGERVLDATIKVWKFSTISGTVTDDAGDAVPGTRVQALKRTILAGRWKLANTGIGGNTDERGAYRITGLLPGDYALVITTLTSTLPSSLLQLADAMRRNPGPEATALRSELTANGTAGFVNDLQQGFPTTRVGDFLIQSSGIVVGNDGRSVEVYPTIWYPAAATPADASVVRVDSGDNRTGVDLRLTLTRTYRISGTVVGPNGPVANLSLRLVPSRLDDVAAEVSSSMALSLNTAVSVTDTNGQFTFLAIPSGQYVIRAATTPRPRLTDPSTAVTGPDGRATFVSAPNSGLALIGVENTFWAATPVALANEDVTGVTVTLRSGFKVSGRVEFEGTAKPPSMLLPSPRMIMEPADGRVVGLSSGYQAQIAPPGVSPLSKSPDFYTTGLMAGRYLLRCDLALQGWTVKSAIVGGRDICDTPLTIDSGDVDGLVITFTDRPSALFGTVRDAQGQPDEVATVLVFPSDGNWTDLGPSPRRLRSARASRTGAFSFWGLPPGDYFIIAVDDGVTSNWQDPSFLQRLSRVAVRLTLTGGQSLPQNLTTVVGISR